MLNYLHFKKLYSKILTLYFLLTFSRTKLTVVLLWMLLVSVYPLSKLETLIALLLLLLKLIYIKTYTCPEHNMQQNIICSNVRIFSFRIISSFALTL
jgi:hypothetical protein